MDKWVCEFCGYVYNPADGDPVGADFENLSDDWVCPVCGANKFHFVKES